MNKIYNIINNRQIEWVQKYIKTHSICSRAFDILKTNMKMNYEKAAEINIKKKKLFQCKITKYEKFPKPELKKRGRDVIEQVNNTEEVNKLQKRSPIKSPNECNGIGCIIMGGGLKTIKRKKTRNARNTTKSTKSTKSKKSINKIFT